MTRINAYYPTQQQSDRENERGWDVSFGLMQLATTSVLTFIHECGHALMALALYENAEPQIELKHEYFYIRGNCKYNASTLNSFGKWMGSANASASVSAAGPIIDIITLLAITKLSRSNRKTAQLIALKAASLSLYAISALWNSSSEHDFSNVWAQGGFLAYSLLTACCFATTAVVLRNATKPLKKRQNGENRYRDFPQKPITVFQPRPIWVQARP